MAITPDEKSLLKIKLNKIKKQYDYVSSTPYRKDSKNDNIREYSDYLNAYNDLVNMLEYILKDMSINYEFKDYDAPPDYTEETYNERFENYENCYEIYLNLMQNQDSVTVQNSWKHKINIKNLLRLQKTKEVRKLHIVLGNNAYKKYGEIDNIFSVNFHPQFNGKDELTFNVYKKADGHECVLWDQIVNFKLIWVKEYNEWFQIKVAIDDSEKITKKVITATSLCEAELSQRLISIEINTEDDISRNDYVKPTLFYNPNAVDCSLLHRVLKDKCSDYTIKHVDYTLCNIQRSFSCENSSVYDFLVETVASEIGCIFLFDTNHRDIYVYDMETTCLSCGYRDEQDFKQCPECGCTTLHLPYGKDTNIMIDKTSIGSAINLEPDTDSVKTCFYVTGGDETINAAFKNINPNGTNMIMYFNDEIKSNMPDYLIESINDYEDLFNEYNNGHIYELNSADISEYNTVVNNVLSMYADKGFNRLKPQYNSFSDLTEIIYDTIDLKMYLENGMMPAAVLTDKNAASQLALLTPYNLSPVSVIDISNISKHTANSAVLAMAKCIIDTGSYKIETSEYNLNGYTWTGKFKITAYANDKDFAESTSSISIDITDDHKEYINQKIERAISRLDDNAVKDIYDIEDIDDFKNELKKYCNNSLNIFHEAIKTVLDVLQEEGHSTLSSDDLYKELYLPYYNKMLEIENEMKNRNHQIEIVDTISTSIQKIISEVHEVLNFHNFIGDTLWKLLLSYIREDIYNNENYISDGLSNSEIIKKCQELKNVAMKELVKSGNQQYTITETLANLLMITDEEGNLIFEPILEDFTLGNFIRTKIDGQIYKMRMVDITINYDNLDTLSVTFSDVIKGSSGISDRLSDTITQVSSISTSYSSTKKQAEQGEKANYSIEKLRTEGLNSAQYNVFNTNSTIEIDEHGLLSRGYDDVNDIYSDEQLRVNHADIIMTRDNWRTTCLAIGKQSYTLNGETYEIYGVNADVVLSGTIIAGDIYSANYTTNQYGEITNGTHINLTDGSFDFAGGDLSYTPGNNNEEGTLIVKGRIIVKDEDPDNTLEHQLGLDIINFALDMKESIVDSRYIISPCIGGGYLDISATGCGRVIIDPSGLNSEKDSNNNYDIFAIYNKNGDKVIGMNTSGDAVYTGDITGSTITGSTIIAENDFFRMRIWGSMCINSGTFNKISDSSYNITSSITENHLPVTIGVFKNQIVINNGDIDFNIREKPDTVFIDKYQIKFSSEGINFKDKLNNTSNLILSFFSDGIATTNMYIGGYNDDNNNGYLFVNKELNVKENCYLRQNVSVYKDLVVGKNIFSDTINTNRLTVLGNLTLNNELQFKDWSAKIYKINITTPSEEIIQSLGISNLWIENNLWVNSYSITASDKNLKNSIELLDHDESSQFIYSLEPVKFKYNNGTNNRYHHGFIAQNVKEKMQHDFGVYVETISTTSEENNNETWCGLRYEEFIADMVSTIQSQNRRIIELENKITKLSE